MTDVAVVDEALLGDVTAGDVAVVDEALATSVAAGEVFPGNEATADEALPVVALEEKAGVALCAAARACIRARAACSSALCAPRSGADRRAPLPFTAGTARWAGPGMLGGAAMVVVVFGDSDVIWAVATDVGAATAAVYALYAAIGGRAGSVAWYAGRGASSIMMTASSSAGIRIRSWRLYPHLIPSRRYHRRRGHIPGTLGLAHDTLVMVAQWTVGGRPSAPPAVCKL
jgi:hypothetical protein